MPVSRNLASWKREAPLANPTGATSQYQSTIYYDPANQLSSVVNQPLAGSTVADTGRIAPMINDTGGGESLRQDS